MENKQIITLAYELAESKYGKKPFTFEQLWKDLVKKIKLDKTEQETVGSIYTNMLSDTRFIFIGRNQWKVKKFLTIEEQEKLSNALYDFEEQKTDTISEQNESNFDDVDSNDDEELDLDEKNIDDEESDIDDDSSEKE